MLGVAYEDLRKAILSTLVINMSGKRSKAITTNKELEL